MNRQEFDNWFVSHCNRFSAVAKMTLNDPTIAEDWFATLSFSEMIELKQASRYIMSANPQPFPSEHLGAIASFIRERRSDAMARARSARTESFRCHLCEDRGTRLVYDHQSVNAARNGTLEPHKIGEMTVACKCEKGEKLACGRERNGKNDRPPPKLPRFSSNWYYACTKVADEKKYEELMAAVAKPMESEWVP